MASPRPPISTHVLDTSIGKAVSGIEVSLFFQKDGSWQLLNSGITSADGRCASFITREQFSSGNYKFTFNAGKYYGGKAIDTLFSEIEVVFKCLDSESHYHIPLLLSPFGYSVYRGT